MKIEISAAKDIVFTSETARDVFLVGRISGKITKAHTYNENGNPDRACVEVPMEELVAFLAK